MTTGIKESAPSASSQRQPLTQPKPSPPLTNDPSMVTSMSLNAEIVTQVRSLLAQGYSVGVEHANKRRFKTGSWQSGGIFSGNQALPQIEASLHDFAGEYVRLIGVDTKAKRRVSEIIIQRPDEGSSNGGRGASSASLTPDYSAASTNFSTNTSKPELDATVVNQVRSLLAQGFKIGTEHTDQRRFRAKSWESCAPITSTREADVLRSLEACLADHQGEYVRLLGIDANAKRRVLETIIQRP
jgi:carbon dioxide concentrating mechanism protein CcmM